MLHALPAATAAIGQLKVCAVLENGFTMLQPSVAAADVTSDDQLRGFDVELRKEVLTGLNYSVRVLSSYGQVNYLTRAAECDVRRRRRSSRRSGRRSGRGSAALRMQCQCHESRRKSCSG